MPDIRLDVATTRSELRRMHEQLAEGDGAAVTLGLGSPLHPVTPGQYSAWLQLILTWGQDTIERELEVSADTLVRVEERQPLSDIEVLAIFLAEVVLVNGEDVTSRVQPQVRQVLVDRDVLTEHHGDGSAPTLSLLLAAHTFTNRTSPELHAPWEGEVGVEETARSLYHDIWPLPRSTDGLRSPLVEFSEVAVPHDAPTHLTRVHVPTDHPAGPGAPFTPLGGRAPQIRGLARDMATEVRVQPKPLRDEVGEILFELIQNTEWHASRWAGGRTGASCRVVSFREYTYDRIELDAAEAFDPNFARYVLAAMTAAERRQGRQVKRITLGSANVVDSGVGLAKSVALSLDEGHMFNQQTEVNYLRAALSKNLKRGRRFSMGAIGLARVQQSLTNLNGFMAVRTGTVELLRDFVQRPFEPLPERARSAPPALLLDWIPPREEDFVVGPRVGTAVTVVYPVDFELST
jgi:hypothetical protein